MVGESGCGKSVTSYAILQLIQTPGRIVGGHIWLHPRDEPALDLVALGPRSEELYRVRGGIASMIFQEPMTALSPVHTIGNQLTEVLYIHQPCTRSQALERAEAMLARVGIPKPRERLSQYPHELSGGMRQRVVIAMALLCRPQLLIADEPTTALDVTIQAQILRLIKSLQAELGMALLLITHDLGVVAQMADEVAVMYLGRVVERGTVRNVLKRPAHPYTRALLESLPSRHPPGSRLPSIPGTVPGLRDIPAGCPFHPRCRYAEPTTCDRNIPPALISLPSQPEAAVACHLAQQINIQHPPSPPAPPPPESAQSPGEPKA